MYAPLVTSKLSTAQRGRVRTQPQRSRDKAAPQSGKGTKGAPATGQPEGSRPRGTKAQGDKSTEGEPKGQPEGAMSPEGFTDELEAVEQLIGSSFDQAIEEQRELEEYLAESDAKRIGVNMSFGELCKWFKIPHELQDSYYTWLLNRNSRSSKKQGQPRFKEDQFPRVRGQYIKPGLIVPPPYGKDWAQLIEDRGTKWKSKYLDYEAAKRAEVALHCVVEAIRAATAIPYIDKELALEDDVVKREQLVASRVILEANKTKKRRAKAKANTGKAADLPECPATTRKALFQENREEANEWLKSVLKEWQGFEDLGVFEHNFTKEELAKRGVTSRPVPLTEALEYKWGKHGELDRRKTRYPLAGHPGNMQKGVHYKETYAPTPSQNSTRLLSALTVLYKLFRKTGDISQAYCRADLPEDELIAVVYPPAFKRTHPVTGEELFALLKKSLYGHPAAGRYWDKWRNMKMLEWFNDNETGWKARRSQKEPSLLIVFHGEEWALVLTHTDDIDAVGTSQEILEDIFSKCNEEWEVKATDPSFMLGIERNMSENEDGVTEIEMKMTAFIEGMMETFKEWKIDKKIDTPVKEGLFISKPWKTGDPSSEAKGKEIIARGGQSLLGMLLWAARGCYPECVLGTSMLGRIMAQPTEEFWNNAVWMMNYMYQNRHRGIKFSSNGNSKPVAFVDSSNKPDPGDGKCQYGYNVKLAGGPVIFSSKKHSHIGLSAAHNEYMALHWCNRHVLWLRQLLTEIGLQEMTQEPTLVRGDNKAANTLCYEDIVTTGNQFIYVPYHFNKEVISQKQVKTLFVRSAENDADLMTKAVAKGVHRNLINRLTGYEVFMDADAEKWSKEKAELSQ